MSAPRKMPRMDAAVPVDAKNAPTGPWKTAQNAVSKSAHTHRRQHALHTKNLTLPTAIAFRRETWLMSVSVRVYPWLVSIRVHPWLENPCPSVFIRGFKDPCLSVFIRGSRSVAIRGIGSVANGGRGGLS